MAHPQIRIPATYLRGGTSKGVFFRLEDLPESCRVPGEARDRLFMRVIGSPDPYAAHIDGMGGATSSTSKCVILSKSSQPGHDVDYLYGQVSIDKPFVDWSGNCGNLSTGAGAFALHAGLVDPARIPENGICEVRIWQANIGKTIIAHVPVSGGQVQETGDFELDGVTFPAAEIVLEFLDPSDDGEDGGAMFPTGNLVDDLEVPGVGTFKATMINAGIPTVFVNAEEIGYRGTELREEINGDPQQLARFERIRVAGALRMGLIKTPRKPRPASTRRRSPSSPRPRLPHRQRQAGGGRRYRPAGPRAVHGQAAPRDDGYRGGGHRHRRGHSRHPGEPRRRRRRTQRGTLRPSLRHPASGRRGQPGERRMDGDQGDHEPQRANPHGRLGARTRRGLLNRPILAPAFRHRERPGRLAATTRKPSPNQPDPRGNPPLTNHWSTR